MVRQKKERGDTVTIDLSKKRIIMIHGLASKPRPEPLHALWSRCLVENIRLSDASLASRLGSLPEAMVHAYWADAVPHHIPDDAGYVRKLGTQVDHVIEARRRAGHRFHVKRSEILGAFFKDRGLGAIKALANALTIKDDVMKAYLRETKLYDEDQYIADRMRRPLEDELRAAWDDDCDVALLSHSMGTFIAYDALWRFSHRTAPEFVQMFVTMGSPLAESAVRDLLFARYHKEAGARGFPTNIDRWHNYACLGDVVSHKHDFERDFFKEMKALTLLPVRPAHRAIDYANLHNPFEVVAHHGNRTREKRNPHKSYGYLVQPRLGSWMIDFLRGNLR